MDVGLAQRLSFFMESGTVDSDLCEFVRDELTTLAAAGFVVTEESAGMFATHLLMALQRVRSGEPVEVSEGAELIRQQLVGQQEAIDIAQQLADRAAGSHQVQLPPHEIDFIALHIATLSPVDAARPSSG